MAELPLSQTVDASNSKTSWLSFVLSLLTSTFLQGLCGIALIVTPLIAPQSMPAPVSVGPISGPYVPVQVTPPVQRGAEQGTTNRLKKPNALVAPTKSLLLTTVEIPSGITETDFQPRGDPRGCIACLPPGWDDPPMLDSAPPAPSPPEPVRISSHVRRPRKVVHVDPIYPLVALAARMQGAVRLQATIDVEGRVVDLKVIKSIALLDRAAIDAVQQWRYEPTILNGRAVPIIMTVSVVFELR